MFDLTNPIFSDVDKAREHLERINWPEGPFCPHCGEVENVKRLEGKSTRAGLIQCNSCHGNFTVTVGTLFERSKVPLNKWMLASYLLAASKKGMSAHQLHRMLGVTYKTAWFMAHRIREAMKDMTPPAMGGEGKIIGADETYYGKRETPHVLSPRSVPAKSGKTHGSSKKRIIFGLVERGGEVRTFHIQSATGFDVRQNHGQERIAQISSAHR